MRTSDLRSAGVGLIYGLALLVFSTIAGFGHGTYALFGVFGAPLSALGPVVLAMPVYWAVVWWAIDSERPRSRLAMWLLLAHYSVAVLVLVGLIGGDAGDLRYVGPALRAAGPPLLLAGPLYLWGQVWAWTRLVATRGVFLVQVLTLGLIVAGVRRAIGSR